MSVFPYGTFAHWVSGTGFVLSIWLGAFIATHVPRRPVSRLAYLSIFSLAGYFLHATLCLYAPAEEAGYLWRRYLGWFALAPLPIWFHLTSILLSEEKRRKQWFYVRLSYAIAILLAITWVVGDWSFSRETIFPPEISLPIWIFSTSVGICALLNVAHLRKIAPDETLRKRQSFLGLVILFLMAAILFWPIVVNILNVPWSGTVKIAVGDIFPFIAVSLLAYSVAFHNMFMSGRWLREDFLFQAGSVLVIASLYVITMLASYQLAIAFNLKALVVVAVAVVGLSILTHLLTQRLKDLRRSIFSGRMPKVGQEMQSLMSASKYEHSALDGQMSAVVTRLMELTGASNVCVALFENEEKLFVRSSTNPIQIDRQVPYSFSGDESIIGIQDPDAEGYSAEERELWDCVVLTEPIQAAGKLEGYLMLGDRGAGEGYDRQERLWISGLAAHLGTALEKEFQLQQTTELIAELKADALDLKDQRRSLERELEQVITAPAPLLSRAELREALYAYSRPERMKELLDVGVKTLGTVIDKTGTNLPKPEAIKELLDDALDQLEPPEGIPLLESFQERILSEKKRHIPLPIANYYTLKLVMAGYTHEDIAEMLVISPRQVRNYLDRGISQM